MGLVHRPLLSNDSTVSPVSSSGSYRNYPDAPMYAGGADAKRLKAIVDQALISFKHFAVIGDSQETIPRGSGIDYLVELNKIAFERYGPAKKLPFYPFDTLLSNSYFCIGSEINSSTKTGVIPMPALDVVESTATNTGPLMTLYPDAGSFAENNNIYFPADTGTLQWEVLLERDTDAASPADEARIIVLNNAADRQYFGTRTTVVSLDTTVGLADNNDTYVLVNSGDISYNSAEPWITGHIYGLNSGGTPDGSALRVVAGRFVDTSRDQGIAWSSFSKGGITSDQYISQFPVATMQAVLAALPDREFDVVFLCFGTNDAGSSLNTPEQFKTNLENLITDTRSKFGAFQFIVLVSEPPRDSYGAGNEQLVDNLRRYGAVAAEVANETSNCAFINLGRALYEFDPLFGVDNADGGTRLDDQVHLSSASQVTAAEKMYEIIDSI